MEMHTLLHGFRLGQLSALLGINADNGLKSLEDDLEEVERL
jgi:hypothetical protein